MYLKNNNRVFIQEIKNSKHRSCCSRLTHREAVEEGLELGLAGTHHFGNVGDLQTQAGHALRLADHGEDLGVEVDKQLLGLRVTHQQRGL